MRTGIASFFFCKVLFMKHPNDHIPCKAPYEKKAEAAKKKYAEEMAAYEAK